jgi:hypothetical protein
VQGSAEHEISAQSSAGESWGAISSCVGSHQSWRQATVPSTLDVLRKKDWMNGVRMNAPRSLLVRSVHCASFVDLHLKLILQNKYISVFVHMYSKCKIYVQGHTVFDVFGVFGL